MHGRLVAAGLAVVAGFCTQTCAAFFAYSAGPTFGTVIDAETKQPVFGAVVIARWDLHGGMHYDRTANLILREAITSESGAFRIDGWGPVARPLRGALDEGEPTILVFKPGYRVLTKYNYDMAWRPKELPSDVWDSRWNGSKFPISRIPVSPQLIKERKNAVDFARRELMGLSDMDRCAWRMAPRAVKIIEAEYLRSYGSAMDAESLPKMLERRGCEGREDFIRAYEAAPACMENCEPPPAYSAGPTHGRVLDAVTGEPVAGAIVIAQWILEGASREKSLFVIDETVTDESGGFRLKSWGPLARPPDAL